MNRITFKLSPAQAARLGVEPQEVNAVLVRTVSGDFVDDIQTSAGELLGHNIQLEPGQIGGAL